MTVAHLQMSTLKVTTMQGFQFQSFKLKSWYLFQAWKINPRHDTLKCPSLSQCYITILSIMLRPETDTNFPTISKGATHLYTCLLSLLVQGSGMNHKVDLPKNYWNNWSLETCHFRGAIFNWSNFMSHRNQRIFP